MTGGNLKSSLSLANFFNFEPEIFSIIAYQLLQTIVEKKIVNILA